MHRGFAAASYSLSISMSVISILKGSLGSICFMMLTSFCAIKQIPLYLPRHNNHRID